MIWTYCVNTIIAAALGAGTNELAIWWVLNKILPKKKGEIARRIRDIVATDLLSPDKMQAKLDDPLIGDLLQKHIDQVATGFLARDLSSPGVLLADHITELDGLTTRLRESILDEFSRRCGQRDFAAKVIRPFLLERWETLKYRSPKSLLSLPPGRAGAFARDWVKSLERSDSLRRHLRQALDTWLSERLKAAETFADLLSPAMAKAAEDLAATQAPVVIERFASLLGEPSVRHTLATSIMAAINEQLRKQGLLGDIKGAVVNALRIENDVRGLCRSLPAKVRDSFTQPASQAQFAEVLRKAVREGLAQKLPDDVGSTATRAHIVDLTVRSMWKTDTFEEFGRRAETLFEEIAGRSLSESVDRLGLGGSIDAVLADAAARCQGVLASDATRTALAGQLDDLIAAWKAKPLGRLERFISPEAKTRAARVAAEEIRLLLRHRVAAFAEESGVWDIITTSIKDYDDKQLSALITKLTRSELILVTVLGGVIGAVVGFAQTFMQTHGWL